MNRHTHLSQGHPIILLNGQRGDAYILLQDWLEETTGKTIYDCEGGGFTEKDEDNTEYTLYGISFNQHEEPSDIVICVYGQMNGDTFDVTSLEIKDFSQR